jgi:nitrate reductase gamma subunit
LEDCRECHPPHDEKISNDAHADVTCQACHLEEILPIKDPKTKAVRWERTSKPGMNSRIHLLVSTTGEAYCQRCHFNGNPVGAASMILPAKSILCMPCHAATFSAGDTTTVLSLIVFLSGLVLTASIWLSGSRALEKNVNPFSMAKVLAGRSAKAIFSQKIILILKPLFYDMFLQRRLYKRSARRWIIHSLIFFPFVFRLGWGFVGLLASIWLPDVSLFWPMLDKNHSTTGFLFDLTGIMIVLGVVLALIRGSSAETEDIHGLPRQDRLALILIGGIVLVGFVLEGIRIAMTGYPENSGYAVVGYGIGKLFSGMTGLTEVFGYVWYAHAVLSGAFIAYLPFSHLKHIIMAPVIMAVHAAADRN